MLLELSLSSGNILLTIFCHHSGFYPLLHTLSGNLPLDNPSDTPTRIGDKVRLSVDEKNDEVSVDLDFSSDGGKVDSERDGKTSITLGDIIRDVDEEIAGASGQKNSIGIGDISEAAAKWLPDMKDAFINEDAPKRVRKRESEDLFDATDLSSDRENLLVQMKKGTEPQWISTLESGRHLQEDGSVYELSDRGRIASFTTAPTKEHPQGLTYSNISYDSRGDLLSYRDPYGFDFQRASGVNEKGFATWTVNKNGHRMQYQGAESSSWVGKPRFDESGFHNLVASGVRANTMYSKNSDGSSSIVNALSYSKGGDITAVRSEVSLADGSKITRRSSLEGETLVPEAKLKIGKKGGSTEQELTVDYENRRASKVERPEAEQESEPKKAESSLDRLRRGLEARGDSGVSSDPIAALQNGLKKLESIDSADVSYIGNGGYRLNVHAEEAAWLPAIDLNRRFVTANETYMAKDFGFDLYPRADGLHINRMHGFSGSVTGPFGGTHATKPSSLHIGRDQGGPFVRVNGSASLRRRSISSSLMLREGNMPEGSPMIEMMDRPEQMKEVASVLSLFQSSSHMQRLSVDKVESGKFDIGLTVDKARNIKLDEPIGKGDMKVESIDLGTDISAQLSSSADGVRMEGIDGMIVNLETGLGKVQIKPLAVALKYGRDGKPIMELEVKSPKIENASIQLEVPVNGGEQRLESVSFKLKVPVSKLKEESVNR